MPSTEPLVSISLRMHDWRLGGTGNAKIVAHSYIMLYLIFVAILIH